MTDAERRIAAALPVIHNGLDGSLDPLEALRWVKHLLRDDGRLPHDHETDEPCWRGCPALR